MLSLDELAWKRLRGGYGLPYDPRPALAILENNPSDAAAWDELWENLHHQGDVGEASYVAFTLLVDMHKRRPFIGGQFLAFAATIETERQSTRNPPVPGWLAPAYGDALGQMLAIALAALRSSTDPLVVRSALAVAALMRGQTKLGALLASFEQSEIEDLAEARLAWSSRYRA